MPSLAVVNHFWECLRDDPKEGGPRLTPPLHFLPRDMPLHDTPMQISYGGFFDYPRLIDALASPLSPPRCTTREPRDESPAFQTPTPPFPDPFNTSERWRFFASQRQSSLSKLDASTDFRQRIDNEIYWRTEADFWMRLYGLRPRRHNRLGLEELRATARRFENACRKRGISVLRADLRDAEYWHCEYAHLTSQLVIAAKAALSSSNSPSMAGSSIKTAQTSLSSAIANPKRLSLASFRGNRRKLQKDADSPWKKGLIHLMRSNTYRHVVMNRRSAIPRAARVRE